MTHELTARHGGTKGWLLAAGVSVLLALAIGPVLTGTATAASPPAVPASTSTQWAYGGQGNATGMLQVDGTSVSWNATYGWTVIFTATNTSASTVQLEEQRTVGIRLTTELAHGNASATYTYHGTEADVAFVNLTNAATVYENGTPVPALGLLNESLRAEATVDQSLFLVALGHSHSGWLNVTGTAHAVVAFTPALGLLPLNLSGGSPWNASAMASPSASWNIDYAWAALGWNGTTRSGSGAVAGNWTVSGVVNVTGHEVTVVHPFADHKVRTGVVLIVQGPVDAYDGYLLIPHDFDLFGGASHPFDAESFGSATVGSGSGETLYVTSSARGPLVSAADSTFAGTPGVDSAFALSSVGLVATPESTPGLTVEGQPMTVPAAQAESACLTTGCGSPSASSSTTSSALWIGLLAVAVVAVVVTVAVIEWSSYSRRGGGGLGGAGPAESRSGPPAPATSPPPIPPPPSPGGRPPPTETLP